MERLVRYLGSEYPQQRKERTMPQNTTVKSGTPSKNAENQDAATLTQSQPSTTEEIEARSGRTTTERDPGLQPATGPSGMTDGDD
jgi:hypothetical protein